jgi:hypothetical protein
MDLPFVSRSLLVYLSGIFTSRINSSSSTFNTTGSVSSITIPGSPTVEMWGLGIIVLHKTFVSCIEKTRIPLVFIGVI